MVIKVCIDPGHGGVEPGATYNGYLEKNINFLISKNLEAELKQKGILTKLTRENDSFVALSQRAYLSNQFKSNYFISIHCNAFSNSIPHGFEIYYYQAGLGLANSILYAVAKDSITTVRYTKQANFTVLSQTQCPAILIENGYMSNPHDLTQLVTASHRKALARSIANGVFKYINSN